MPIGFGQAGFGQPSPLSSAVIGRLLDFANNALGQAGQNFITSLDGPELGAVLCKQWLERLLRATLRDHFWNFASKRKTLTAAAVPLMEWRYAFTLPDDNVRVKQLGDDPACQPEWVVEQRLLLTNEPTAKILYIAIIPDPDVWDTLFYDTFSTRMASKLAMTMTKDVKFANGLYGFYRELISGAQAVDGQETGKQDRQNVTDLLDGRND